MKLYATQDRNTSVIKRLEVFDNNGLAFIRKEMPDGRIIEWTCPDRSAAEWVELNKGRRGMAPWHFM